LKAIAFFEYGDVDVLRLVDLATPKPSPGQVLIAVRAAGVNPVDWKIRSGAVAETMPVRLPAVPGVDVAGVVDRVGPGVTDFQPGDEVFGKAVSGSYAELALVHAAAIARKPAAMPWAMAAALPVAATTAHHALTLVGLTAGETVVIDGAAGGVAAFPAPSLPTIAVRCTRPPQVCRGAVARRVRGGRRARRTGGCLRRFAIRTLHVFI
jgi:NADPH:quinone reductase-like Zn-dependent oxidoreductase